MIDWLVVWGVGHFIFRPILEDLAKDPADSLERQQ
jgi:hypothetical protein